MSRLYVDDFVGKIGSLDTGTSVARLPLDRLPYKRNVEHHTTGAVTKRPGRKRLAKVAPAPEAAVAPALADRHAVLEPKRPKPRPDNRRQARDDRGKQA